VEKAIREEADAGAPVIVSGPDTVRAKAFRDFQQSLPELRCRASVSCR